MSKRSLPKVPMNSRPGVRTDITKKVIQRWNPDIKAAADNDSTISVLDAIGEDWDGEGVTAKRISAALRRIGEGDVVVNINSPGGDFFEGLAIYSLLREHKGKVTVNVLGIAASAASIIAMAGDEVRIARAAFFMIHNTWVMAAGDRHAFREVADWLAPFDEAAVGVYAARTGLEADEIAKMCDRESWIGGAAAVEQGFADELLESDAVEAQPSNAAPTQVAAQKKLDIALASGQRMSKNERRKMFAALKGGMSGAAPTGMSGAAVKETMALALAKLEKI